MYGIIFTRTKADAQDISEKLSKAGYDIEAFTATLPNNNAIRSWEDFAAKHFNC